MEKKDTEIHPLTLKVMRLTKPQMLLTHLITSELPDLPGDSLANVQGISSVAAASDTLILPQSFGTIYLGETFTSYISVHNDSNELAADVVVKTELQTTTQRLTLNGNEKGGTPRPMEPGSSLDDIVHHEMKELGIHILVCSVHYTSVNGDRKFFRKFFKFQVLKPLEVKTKTYNLEGCILLEGQIQNITQHPIFLSEVKLLLNPNFNLQDLNVLPEGTTFDSAPCLQPEDTRQYVYKLTPVDVHSDTLATATTVGRLDIVWKSYFGEIGRLQTSQLPRKPPVPTELSLTAKHIPAHIECGTPFILKCAVSNVSKQPMELFLMYDPKFEHHSHSGLVLDGVSGLSCSLPASHSTILPLNLFPKSPGLFFLEGICLWERITNRYYPLSCLPALHVHRTVFN